MRGERSRQPCDSGAEDDDVIFVIGQGSLSHRFPFYPVSVLRNAQPLKRIFEFREWQSRILPGLDSLA